MRMQCALILALVLTCTCYASAQRSSSSDKAAEKDLEDPYWHDWKKELYEQGIQDNSFLVEEAYNQDYGVVQHINNFAWLAQSKLWVYSFTQEWPVDVAPKNQLSFTVQATHNGAFAGSRAGIGDALINYRYQLVGNGDARVANPARTILQPKNNLECGVKILYNQIIVQHKPLLASTGYWSTLRAGNPSYRVFAKQMINPPAACGLPTKSPIDKSATTKTVQDKATESK